MGKLNRSNDTTNKGPGQLTINQRDFREQQDVVGDSLLQLGGRGEVEPGSGKVNDPLNAPFVIYVNPYTGKDDFVFGDYASADDNSFEQEIRRIELQRLSCGYTEAAPFKTINRAIIEVGLITSKSYWSGVTAADQLVSIVLAPANYVLNCGAGSAASSVSAFVPGTTTVDDAFFLQFNPQTTGGIILPRGASLISLDLRKTILRPGPSTVPAMADESATNRRSILKVTGNSYMYGLTFMDTPNATTSHHLMSCFEFAGKSELDDFYTKITNAFATPDANFTSASTRATEYQIVADKSNATAQASTDSTASSSPYIYNCSIRSEYGLCSVYADGSVPTGFSSLVSAQLTGVCLQKDYRCFQTFSGGSWTNLTNDATGFTNYRNADPDNVRMDPKRRSFHIRAVNGALIQEVSNFAIGHGVHHWCQSGSDISITNSDSNFGGVSSLAESYRPDAIPTDTGFTATHIRVPTDLSEETNNIRTIFIGVIDSSVTSQTATAIKLTKDLTGTVDNKPLELGNYTLEPGSYLWVESNTNADYRAPLATTAWDADSDEDTINITTALVTDSTDGNHAPGSVIGSGPATRSTLAGSRVYIRRLIDTRTQSERRYALLFDPIAANRAPQRDYILRTDGDGVGNASAIDVAVLRSGSTKEVSSNADKVQVELKQINPDQAFRADSIYRPGDSLVQNGKHYICNVEVSTVGLTSAGTAFVAANFEENYVHMQTGNQGVGYMPEDFFKNVQPILTFDNDSDEAENSTTLGWVFNQSASSNVWTGSEAKNKKIQAQFTSATDYRGLDRYLKQKSLTISSPRPAASRDISITNQSNQEFRRPSIIRSFAMAFEWAGFGNYTKGLPKYQKGMLAANQFTYFATSELGGRVYWNGFTEEGFQVSPRGVEDIQTGEVLSPEGIGAPDVDLDVPTTFDNLTVTNTLTAGTVDVQTKLDVAGATVTGLDASTTAKGIIEIADAAEITAGTSTDTAVTPAQLAAAIAAATGSLETIPSGVIQWFCGAEASKPTGWLVCDGSTVPNGSGTVQGVTADFSDLFTLLGSTYGAAGQLPDLQGTFVRGWTNNDSGAYNETAGANYNPDPSRDRGTLQNNEIQSHAHTLDQTDHSHQLFNQIGGSGSAAGDGGSNTSDQNSGGAQANITITGPSNIGGNTVDTNANETRPTNIALLPIIKI